jgi:hypothetical protein
LQSARLVAAVAELGSLAMKSHLVVAEHKPHRIQDSNVKIRCGHVVGRGHFDIDRFVIREPLGRRQFHKEVLEVGFRLELGVCFVNHSIAALLHGEWVIVDVQSAFGPLLTVDF